MPHDWDYNPLYLNHNIYCKYDWIFLRTSTLIIYFPKHKQKLNCRSCNPKLHVCFYLWSFWFLVLIYILAFLSDLNFWAFVLELFSISIIFSLQFCHQYQGFKLPRKGWIRVCIVLCISLIIIWTELQLLLYHQRIALHWIKLYFWSSKQSSICRWGLTACLRHIDWPICSAAFWYP